MINTRCSRKSLSESKLGPSRQALRVVGSKNYKIEILKVPMSMSSNEYYNSDLQKTASQVIVLRWCINLQLYRGAVIDNDNV